MFTNEIPVTQTDKEKLTDLLQQTQSILNKYPYENYAVNAHTVTTMSRAKTAVNEAARWCNLLETK